MPRWQLTFQRHHHYTQGPISITLLHLELWSPQVSGAVGNLHCCQTACRTSAATPVLKSAKRQTNAFPLFTPHQETPLALVQAWSNLLALVTLASQFILAGLGPASAIFCKCSKFDKFSQVDCKPAAYSFFICTPPCCIDLSPTVILLHLIPVITLYPHTIIYWLVVCAFWLVFPRSPQQWVWVSIDIRWKFIYLQFVHVFHVWSCRQPLIQYNHDAEMIVWIVR